jgi:two-component system KDP operon response regulator KdpE
MEAKILFIEDDLNFSYLLCEQLGDDGFEVICGRDGVEGLRMLQEHTPDLVLLDVMMPRMDGWETCRLIRELSDVPIIIMSCRTTALDKVRGLELGADDYISKPFDYGELLARIQAALRRSNLPVTPREIVRVDERLAIDKSRRKILVDGTPVKLSAVEYRLLSCFLDHAGHILTHKSILTQVWGWEYADETSYLKVYIHHLRKKIELDPKNPRYILTEWGLGYRFQGPGLS